MKKNLKEKKLNLYDWMWTYKKSSQWSHDIFDRNTTSGDIIEILDEKIFNPLSFEKGYENESKSVIESTLDNEVIERINELLSDWFNPYDCGSGDLETEARELIEEYFQEYLGEKEYEFDPEDYVDDLLDVENFIYNTPSYENFINECEHYEFPIRFQIDCGDYDYEYQMNDTLIAGIKNYYIDNKNNRLLMLNEDDLLLEVTNEEYFIEELDCSSFLWLLKSQGYTYKDWIKAQIDSENGEHLKSVFLRSLIHEVYSWNIGDKNCNFPFHLEFAFKINIKDYIELRKKMLYAEKFNTNDKLVIKKENIDKLVIGMNTYQGYCCYGEIKLEKEIEIDLKNIININNVDLGLEYGDVDDLKAIGFEYIEE